MSTTGAYYLYKGDTMFTSFACYEDYLSFFKCCLRPLGLGTRYLFSKQRQINKNRYVVDTYLRLVTEPGRGGNIESI